ncbi:MAG: hypothetical protein QGH94_02110 [Phycisphaerae bacterium]|jgi:hypothetical protein|nr:hypothetical protein [Phycisphaerae bacterium]MDP7286768.1 hypothetical protein [Phycisphaerae bacterium]
MTNAQTKLITAGIVFGLGAVAAGVGILAMATDRFGGESGPVPGGIAMIAGFVLGVVALKQMNQQERKPDMQPPVSPQ